MKSWTKEEEKLLREKWVMQGKTKGGVSHFDKEMSELLHRSPSSISLKRQPMKLVIWSKHKRRNGVNHSIAMKKRWEGTLMTKVSISWPDLVSLVSEGWKLSNDKKYVLSK